MCFLVLAATILRRSSTGTLSSSEDLTGDALDALKAACPKTRTSWPPSHL
jgi:hypothetical protein